MKIFKKLDGGVVISHFVKNKVVGSIAGLQGIELEESDLPAHEYHESLYFDGDCIKENLKVDTSWEVQLMPEGLIKEKHLTRVNTKLDQELNKQTPSLLDVVKLQRKKEKAKDFKTKEWYQQALANLDERVANGEPDKPLIRQKLQEKINES